MRFISKITKILWTDRKYWQRGAIIGLVTSFLLFFVSIVVLEGYYLKFENSLVCPNLGGGTECGFLGFIIWSLIVFIYYSLIVVFPLIIFGVIVGNIWDVIRRK